MGDNFKQYDKALDGLKFPPIIIDFDNSEKQIIKFIFD